MMNVLFDNPTFNAGLNVTCRRPSSRYEMMQLCEEVALCRLDGTVVDIGAVFLLARYESVANIPQELLDLEHDPGCRTHDGLLAELNRVYGEYGDEEPVVVIGFAIGG